MGVGFVIFIHLVAIFIICSVIVIVGNTIIYFISKKNKRRRLLFTSLAPFVLLYTLYICALIGSIIVSQNKKVDIGIGDSWYVPLENGYQLLFIDLTEQAFIEKNSELIISEIEQIEENKNWILGKTYSNGYFCYNTKTNELKNFNNENELTVYNSNIKPQLKNVYDFYLNKRDNVAGNWFIVVGIFSLIISIAVVYLLKIIVFEFELISFSKRNFYKHT